MIILLSSYYYLIISLGTLEYLKNYATLYSLTGVSIPKNKTYRGGGKFQRPFLLHYSYKNHLPTKSTLNTSKYHRYPLSRIKSIRCMETAGGIHFASGCATRTLILPDIAVEVSPVSIT